jgi:hypothetical protein
MLLFQRGRLPEAETALRRAARLIEGTAGPPPSEVSLTNLYLVLAKLRFGNSDYWEALRHLSRIPQGSAPVPVQEDIDILAGKCLLGVGQPGQGLARLKAIVQTNPSNATAHLHLTWAALLAGDSAMARETLSVLETKWPEEPQVAQLAAIVERESLPIRRATPLFQPWRLSGEGLVCCPCKVPCPCRSNGAPSEGHCESTGAFRIKHGHYGGVRLDNFIFVTMSGRMENCSAPGVVFVSPNTTDEQLIALEHIYQAFNPLHFVLFPSVKQVPILYAVSQNSRTYHIEIPGRLQLKVERQLDQEGRPRMQTAALDHFANTIEYAQNLIYRSWDETGSMQWDYSRRQANFRVIDLDTADYSTGKMLIQFEDDSGYFNRKQMELIKDLKLPMLPGYPQEVKGQ